MASAPRRLWLPWLLLLVPTLLIVDDVSSATRVAERTTGSPDAVVPVWL